MVVLPFLKSSVADFLAVGFVVARVALAGGRPSIQLMVAVQMGDVESTRYSRDKGPQENAAKESMRQHRNFLFDADTNGDQGRAGMI